MRHIPGAAAHRTRTRTLLAAALLLLPPALFTVVAQTGGFSGRVTDAAGGRPLANATVTAHDLQGRPVATTTTDATGTFTTPPLTVGVYVAKAGAGADYRDEVYRDIPCVAGCDVRVGVRISIQSNVVIPGVNFTLDRARTSAAPPSPAQGQPQGLSPAQPPAPSSPAPSASATAASATAPATGGQSGFGSAASRTQPPPARDTSAPVLVLPRLVSAVAVAPAGAPVVFEATALVAGGGTVAATCQPASGSIFPIGTTRVDCSASVPQADVATGSFTVNVTPPSVAGRMRGDGRVAAGEQQHHVRFNVLKRGLRSETSVFDDDIVTKTDGQTRQDRFRATLLSNVYYFDAPGSAPGAQPATGIDQCAVTGLGTWNGETGYTFQLVVVDAGEPGKGTDTIALTIRRPDGAVVATVSGPLMDGNIDSY